MTCRAITRHMTGWTRVQASYVARVQRFLHAYMWLWEVNIILFLIYCGIAQKKVPKIPCSESYAIVAYESDYFNKLWDCPEGGSSNPGLGSGADCSPWIRVDRGSNAIPEHPITAGSAKLPDLLIREAEETMENNIRKAIGNGDPMQRVNYQISLYPPHEERKVERRVRKIHQELSGEVGNL